MYARLTYVSMKTCRYASMQECYMLLAICDLLYVDLLITESFYLKLAINCNNYFLSLVVVRLVIFTMGSKNSEIVVMRLGATLKLREPINCWPGGQATFLNQGAGLALGPSSLKTSRFG